jgi:aminoglycoside phosphotransferase family enzyme/predicted kinase
VPRALPELIAALADPAAYPHPAGTVEVHQTHISVVFLAGDFAYKIKKPVSLGFLDFSTLERRKHFCAEEVRLNRRLAPHVYLGMVPITSASDRLCVGGAGPVVEWAVQMKRLPATATLESRLIRGELQPETLRTLAQRLAAFYRQADHNEEITSFGRFDIVAANLRENFQQTAPHIGMTVEAGVHERVRTLTEQHLHAQRPLMEARAAQGVPRDTHGDLHLDHVYLFPDVPPPGDLLMIDCIEFAERLRYADPVADMAFLAMDLAFHGRRDLAQIFTDAYFEAAQDDGGRMLLPLYTAYRAVVRAKVEAMELSEREIDTRERMAAQARAGAHWLLALGELEAPQHRPALVMLGGLPGTGKSTLAQALGRAANFQLLRSDVIRKELAGPGASSKELGKGIYDASWNERTYAEMLHRADECWRHGGRVLIDAGFRAESQREQFLHAALRWCVPAVFLHCQAHAAVVRARLQARHGDASDADWHIHQALAQTWQPFAPPTERVVHPCDTSGSLQQSAQQALAILRDHALV